MLQHTMPHVIWVWTHDLLSGNYEQGYSTLQDENNYCCLGVACISLQKRKLISKNSVIFYPLNGKLKGDDLGEQEAVFKKLNLQKYSGTNKNRSGNSLTSLNDSWGWSFKKIAIYLREHWKNYVTQKSLDEWYLNGGS